MPARRLTDAELRAELLYALARSSRANPDGIYRREVRRLLDRPEALDYLERIAQRDALAAAARGES